MSHPEIVKSIPEAYKAVVVGCFTNPESSFTFRPSEIILSDSSPIGFFSFVFDLHVRSFLFSTIIFSILIFFGHLEEYLQFIPYKNRSGEIAWYDRSLLWAFGIELSENAHKQLFEKKKIAIRIFGVEILKWFRDAIYHPWAQLTRTNRKREILMVDVLLKEGSLYSGAFTTWSLESDSVSEITMEYGIRYYPIEEEQVLPTTSGNSVQKIVRKKSLIRNNGELILPRENIETVHFWEIRKNTEVTLVVKRAQDIESLKWFLQLAYVYPNYINKISVQVHQPEWNKFRSDLRDWLADTRIKFDKKDIEINVFKKA